MTQRSSRVGFIFRLVLLLAGLSIGFARIGYADDCSLTLNCGECNSGSFTVSCQCHGSSSYACTGCMGTCINGGCRCGHTTTTPVTTSCSKTGCGSTPQCSRLRAPGGHSPILLASSSSSLASLALIPLERVQDSQGDTAGTVSGANAPLETNVSPETGIEITDVKVNATSNKFSGGSFTIKNLTDRDLISYSLSMNLSFDSDPDHPLHMGVTEMDGF